MASAPGAEKGGTLDTSVPNPEEVAKQEKLDSYVDPLLESGLLESADNYGSNAVDYDANAFDMWWRGDVPQNVQNVLDNFGDVEVRLHEAKYTAREIEAAANRVAQYPSDQFDVITTTLGSLDRPSPVYGIEVEVKVHGDMSHTEISAELTKTVGLPVSVNQDLASIPASRANDTSPYFAGGILDAPLSLCTTGFAVKHGGVGKLLSAAHCSGTTGTLYDGVGTVMANPPPNHLRSTGLDSLLFDPVGSSSAATYTGPSTGPVSYRYVKSATSNTFGKVRCQSGSNSGERCGLAITDALIGPCGNAAVCRFWEATDGAGVNLAQGDSGGPVYAVRSDGAVAPAGIVSSGVATTTVTCDSGVRFGAPNQCFRNIRFVDMTDILAFWGATLLTVS